MDFYETMKAYKQAAIKNGEWLTIMPEARRYVEKQIAGMNKDGLELDKETRDQLSKLRAEISDLTRRASHNIDTDATKVEFAISELKGLNDEFVSKLQPVKGKEETHRYISLSKPEIGPALGQATNPEVRRKMQFAKETQVMNQNVPLLENIIKKRG